MLKHKFRPVTNRIQGKPSNYYQIEVKRRKFRILHFPVLFHLKCISAKSTQVNSHPETKITFTNAKPNHNGKCEYFKGT